MGEPTSSTAAVVATISAITLALLGVQYYALLWAFVGAMVALIQSASMTRGRACVYVLLSTLAGAALGQAAVAWVGSEQRALLVAASLLGGVGAPLVVSSLLRAALRLIDTYRNTGDQP